MATVNVSEPRLEGKVKKIRKTKKMGPEIIDAEAITIEEAQEEEATAHRLDIIAAIIAGGLLGYGIVVLGKLGAFLAFALGAGYFIKEVVFSERE